MVDTERLKILRCSHSFYKSKDFAERLGMTPKNYSNRERGKVKFSADEIMKVCEVLGISLEEGIQILS